MNSKNYQSVAAAVFKNDVNLNEVKSAYALMHE